MAQTLDIYAVKDGFYVGRMCKNGKPTKWSYKIKGEDIMTMFTQFFTDYCEDTHKTQLLMQDEEGRVFVTQRVIKDEKSPVASSYTTNSL